MSPDARTHHISMSGPLPVVGGADRGDQNSQFRTLQLNIIEDPAHAPNGGYLEPSLSTPSLTRTSAALTRS